jgi:hypothetical protein
LHATCISYACHTACDTDAAPNVDAADAALRADNLPLRQTTGPVQAGQADLSRSSRIWADLLIIDYSPADAALGTTILLSAL